MKLGYFLQNLIVNRNQVHRFSTRAYSTVPKQVLVARYSNNGPATEVVKVQTEDLPPVSKTGVVLKMLYAPINPADINIISGTYPIRPNLPAVGGSEGLGQVIDVGERASKFKIGDLVLPAKPGFGTWRTHASCEESDLIAVPPASDVKHEYLATLSVNPATAFRLLTDFVKLSEGDVIIQNGANSMVGLSVVQLAAARGIKSINIIRRRSDYDELVEKMKQYGAYIVVADDYIRTAEFRKLISDLPKPKLALNCVGGNSVTEMARLLDYGSTLVTYGGMSLKPITIPTSCFIFNDIILKGFWLTKWYESNGPEARTALLKELISLVQHNKLRLWAERHPFSTFDMALARALNSSSRDRKVLLSFQNQ